jgi:GTP cyclohydrolase I
MASESANTQTIENSLRDILRHIGDNPDREGLKDTPQRIIRSWSELFCGYKQNPADLMRFFSEGSCNEMVVLRDIEFYSMCEHHFLPFFGRVHIAYIPDGKVIGISKLARLVEVYSRRLQIQENMTAQIADAIMEHLQAKGAMVVCEAQHLCMVARGVKKQNSTMVTSAIRGVFEKQAVRAEFMGLTK